MVSLWCSCLFPGPQDFRPLVDISISMVTWIWGHHVETFLWVLELIMSSPKVGIKAPILNESPMFAASNTCGGDLIKTVGANSFWFYSEELFYFILFLDLDLFKFE